MTDLTRLRVSLTKHNAHKVAFLLKTYDAAEVIAHLDEVNAEIAQARKNLSAGPNDVVPPVWGKVQRLGPEAIDSLVLLAIIFSHHALITAMVNAASRIGPMGTILRDVNVKGKEYTNFARILDQLGVATKHTPTGVSFDLSGLFLISGLGPLFAELLELKLRNAGWSGTNKLTDEAVALGLHTVFGMAQGEFVAWLSAATVSSNAKIELSEKDREFFQQQSEGPPPQKFVFRPGHMERSASPIAKSASQQSIVNQLHNDIQNRLFLWLQEVYGNLNVGTEVDTGSGTSVDIAVRDDDRMIFYEIKTGSSVRANIRQALPQLLEYAHWIEDCRADLLVVVSHLPITDAAERYLNFLRTKYGIPVSYQQFDLKTGRLV